MERTCGRPDRHFLIKQDMERFLSAGLGSTSLRSLRPPKVSQYVTDYAPVRHERGQIRPLCNRIRTKTPELFLKDLVETGVHHNANGKTWVIAVLNGGNV